MNESWPTLCRHGSKERWCDDCYNLLRVKSEALESGDRRLPAREYGYNYRLYKRGDLHRVDSVLQQLDTEFGKLPRVRVKLK